MRSWPAAAVTWTSSAAGVATVSSTGLVTAVATGTATVSAVSGAASATAAITVTIDQPATSLVVSPANLAMSFTGENVRVTVTDGSGATVDPSTLTWSSSNPQIATVSASGVVSAVATGNATVTAAVGTVTGSAQAAVQIQTTGHEANRASVPMGGNTWMINGGPGEGIAPEGVIGWATVGSTARTYIRVNQPGTFLVSVSMTAPTAEADLELSINGTTRLLVPSGGAAGEYFAGSFTIAAAGYVSVDLKGISRTGADFGMPSAINVSGTAVTADMNYVRNNDNSMFYFGRRGPSTHWNWSAPPAVNVQWMYSELTIAPGQDVVGTYFMANGFDAGYFGMQVNSDTRRQFIFSIWSPFETDDPSSIPENQRVRPLRQGDGVIIAEFGAEGSGGQSRLEFNWQAGSTYRFLTKFEPQGDGSTDFTAWVYFPETQAWKLIATFKRPLTNSFGTGLYSFLENFEPDQGNITRRGSYENQWVAGADGVWNEVTDLSFSVDNTGSIGARQDFTGGIAGGKAYLQMGGFFNEIGIPGMVFTRASSAGPPVIDLSSLP